MIAQQLPSPTYAVAMSLYQFIDVLGDCLPMYPPLAIVRAQSCGFNKADKETIVCIWTGTRLNGHGQGIVQYHTLRSIIYLLLAIAVFWCSSLVRHNNYSD